MQLRSYYEIGLPDISTKLLHLTWMGVAYNSRRWTEVVGRRCEVRVCVFVFLCCCLELGAVFHTHPLFLVDEMLPKSKDKMWKFGSSSHCSLLY